MLELVTGREPVGSSEVAWGAMLLSSRANNTCEAMWREHLFTRWGTAAIICSCRSGPVTFSVTDMLPVWDHSI